ncbi:putative ribonuclease H protein, partial [Trifolium medium]|nr:putative ribonuclease H protein [Trifolium medium]
TVGEMGSWVEGQWVWDLRWRKDLFVLELNLLDSLHEILNRSTISAADDSWFWKHDPIGQYSIKSAFLALSRSTTYELIFFEEEERLLPKVWKTFSPSKVAVFSWQLLQDKLPTRQNLWQRGVIGDASVSTCVLCGLEPKSADHLFSSCNRISPAWYGILRGLGVKLVPPRGVLGIFEAFLGIGMSRKDML